MDFQVGDKVTYCPIEYTDSPGQTGYQWAIEYVVENRAYSVIEVCDKENGIRIKGKLKRDDGLKPDEIWVNASQFVKHDPNAAYNAKVREIAEVLAKVCTGDCWPDRSEFQREADIRREMSRARAMVAKMAEEFKAGFNGVYDFTDDPDFGPIIKQQLIERGLVPANIKTMAEQQMTYQEKLQKEIYEVRDYTSTDDNAKDLAKDNIAAQAESIREYYRFAFPDESEFYVNDFLISHGYIEPKTEEDDAA